jgi:hypothetical protein
MHLKVKRTWRHDASELDANSPIEKKIELFYDFVWGSQLHVADLMINGGKHHDGQTVVTAIPHAAFGALFILVNYFEMIAHYHAGTAAGKAPREWFYEGVRLVFPDDLNKQNRADADSLLDKLYVKVRCGLYHVGRTRSGIGLWGKREPITYFRSGQLFINPHALAGALKYHFHEYVERLKNPSETELRNAFESRFDEAEKE